jgi:hypothetical protein
MPPSNPTSTPVAQQSVLMPFLLSQRYAPAYGLRDILDVGDVNHIAFNGDTHEYIYYITSLVLQTAKNKLTIYHCMDGSLADDDSDEWQKLDPEDTLKGGSISFRPVMVM